MYCRRPRPRLVKFEEYTIAAQTHLPPTPSEISELARHCAVFVPGDPARAGRVAFWRSDGEAPTAVSSGSVTDLTVVLPDGDGVRQVSVPALLLPVRAALPVLTRARVDADGHRATVFWGAVAVEALHLVARGLLLPGLSATDHDAWRTGPLRPEDTERIRHLAASMPPEAHAVPVDDVAPCGCPTRNCWCEPSSTPSPTRCPAPPRPSS